MSIGFRDEELDGHGHHQHRPLGDGSAVVGRVERVSFQAVPLERRPGRRRPRGAARPPIGRPPRLVLAGAGPAHRRRSAHFALDF